MSGLFLVFFIALLLWVLTILSVIVEDEWNEGTRAPVKEATMSWECQVYLPGEEVPTDLEGYGDYVEALFLEERLWEKPNPQLPHYWALDFESDSTEITKIH